MGDRALVTFRGSSGYSPVIYLHWAGSKVPELLTMASPRMRHGDQSYAAARFCGVCHEQISGSLSLGLLDTPTEDDLRSPDFSHGDAGVFVVDVNTGEVSQFWGYIPDGWATDPPGQEATYEHPSRMPGVLVFAKE